MDLQNAAFAFPKEWESEIAKAMRDGGFVKKSDFFRHVLRFFLSRKQITEVKK